MLDYLSYKEHKWMKNGMCACVKIEGGCEVYQIRTNFFVFILYYLDWDNVNGLVIWEYATTTNASQNLMRCEEIYLSGYLF